MEKQKKKQIKRYISWGLVLLLVAALAVLPVIASTEEPETGPQASILSTTAEHRDISSAILGGGTVAAGAAEAVTVPAAVKIKEYLVADGDLVTEGQPIASVDRVSVMTAITQVQETLEYLRQELNDIRDDTESSKVTATAGGTVKAVYAAVDEDVQDVMLRDGALAVLSLDGLMAVQIVRHTDLSGGDTVCVTLPDGSEVDGKVESNLEGILTVTIADDGYSVGDEVKVTTEDNARIGSGALYIHSPWNVVAYAGTVSRVRVREGTAVSAGQRLFDLKIAGHTAQFDSLSRQHREYEALMLELFKMYQSETVTAPCDGMVSGVDEAGAFMLCASGGWQLTLLANGPGGDENEYINYVGLVTEVGSDGLIMKMNPQAISVTDYHDLSGVPLDTELMTQSTAYTGNAPVYVLSEVTVEEDAPPETTTPPDPTAPSDPTAPTEPAAAPDAENRNAKEWVQVSPYSVAAGDILLFAGGSSGVVWVIKVSHVELSQPTRPENPAQPDSTPQQGGSAGAGIGGAGVGGAGGSRTPGAGSGANPEKSTELYALDTVQIASVTEQEQVTVQITVDELDITQIHTGQGVHVTLDALNGQVFDGTVTEISGSGTNEGGNSKFEVTVALSKAENMLPGMTAHVSIVVDTTESAVSIPVAALVETGTETVVYTGYDEETEAFTGPVAVSTGKSDGTYVQILSGITAGQTVYYPYYDTLIISNAPEMSGFSFG